MSEGSNALKIVALGIIGIIILAIFAGIWVVSTRNAINNARIDADTAGSNAAIKMQDRLDVIPAMKNAAEASFKFQTKLASDYARNREGLDQAYKDYQAAYNDTNDPERAVRLDQAVRNAKKSFDGIIINARTESVPQANLDALIAMQNEVATRQNGVSKYREDYNTAIKEYNKMVTNIPSSWIASLFDFKTMKTFEAYEEAKKMPDTSINV